MLTAREIREVVIPALEKYEPGHSFSWTDSSGNP